MKLWNKEDILNKKVEEFTVGDDRNSDIFLAKYDVIASIAHAKMLSKTIESCGGAKPEISSLRLGESKGDHSIIFSNSEESITLDHKVFSRNTYVAGSVEACKWGIGKKPGFYSMQDVF